MGAGAASLDRLRAIKDLGVYVGIDDFGTGHSSLARLRSLPVEVLKVDRSFIDGLGTEHEDSAVVAAVLSLAHALGLHVIAEGVETPLQANQLIALGCPVAQGFLWSPAVPAEQIPAHGGARHRRAPARDRASRRAQPGRRDDAPDRDRQRGPEVSVVAGILALLTGIAYTGLGVITGYELMRHRRSRGFSHFGAAFLVMAFTCGPHHLVHAWRHLIAAEPAHGPMIAALAIGLAPGLIFIGLRAEAAFGGRGDRLIAGTPLWLELIPALMAIAAGAVLWETLRHAAAMDVDLRALIPNAILFVNYFLVGFFTGRTQLARRPVLAGWSLSGVAMSGVFTTCAASHLVAGLLTTAEPLGVALRQRRRPRLDLLPVGRAPPAPRLAARLEPPPARRSRRPAGPPVPLGRPSRLNSPAPNGASQSRVAL